MSYFIFTTTQDGTELESEPLIFGGGQDYDFSVEYLQRDGDTLRLRILFDSVAHKAWFVTGLYATIGFPASKPADMEQEDWDAINRTFRGRMLRFTTSIITATNVEAATNVEGDFVVTGNINIHEDLRNYPLGVFEFPLILASPILIDQDEISGTLPVIVGSSTYNIYQLNNGRFTRISSTSSRTFNLTNFDSLSSTGTAYTLNQSEQFGMPGDYPDIITFYQQRKIFASSESSPSKIWFSAIGGYEDFEPNIFANSPIVIELASNTLDEVTHIVPLGRLAIFTQTSEWILRNESTLTPANVAIQRVGNVGSSAEVDPVVADGIVLFATNSRDDIRQLQYDFDSDSHTTTSITNLSRHLFEGRSIVRLAFWNGTLPILAVLLDNGSIAAAVFSRSYGVLAWSLWSFNGSVKDIIEAPDKSGFYLTVENGGFTSIEYLNLTRNRWTDGLVDNAIQFEISTLPPENEDLDLTQKYSISDVYVKTRNTKHFFYGINFATHTFSEERGVTGTNELDLEDSWTRDSRVVISDNSANPVEILSLIVEGGISAEGNEN